MATATQSRGYLYEDDAYPQFQPRTHLRVHSFASSSTSSSSTSSSAASASSVSSAHRLPDFLKLPDSPIKIKCPNCKQFVTTYVEYRNGTCVWLLASGLLMTTVVLFWVPFYVNALKDVEHLCPHCRQNLGKKNRL